METVPTERGKEAKRSVFVRRNGKVFRVSVVQKNGETRKSNYQLHPRRRARIFDLPLEIRQQIYTLLTHTSFPIDLRHLHRPHPLALANRQLFHEVTQHYFDTNEIRLGLHFKHTPCDENWCTHPGGSEHHRNHNPFMIPPPPPPVGPGPHFVHPAPPALSVRGGRRKDDSETVSGSFSFEDLVATGNQAWLKSAEPSLRLRRLIIDIESCTSAHPIATISLIVLRTWVALAKPEKDVIFAHVTGLVAPRSSTNRRHRPGSPPLLHQVQAADMKRRLQALKVRVNCAVRVISRRKEEDGGFDGLRLGTDVGVLSRELEVAMRKCDFEERREWRARNPGLVDGSMDFGGMGIIGFGAPPPPPPPQLLPLPPLPPPIAPVAGNGDHGDSDDSDSDGG